MDATASTSDENIDWFYGAKKEEKRDDRQGKCTAIDEINDQKMSTSNHLLSEKKRTRFSLFEESLGCFNVFKRQRDALARMNEEGPHSRVFSFEHSLSNSGQRRYLVSTVERFWRWYEKREDASFYELIANGCPSRLYFDVEFYRESNNDAVESELIAAFNHCVRETLNEVFHIDIDPDKAMLVLDASTKTKFSEHIIVHLPGRYLFPSNVSMKKSFIDILEARMRDSGRAIVWNRDATKKITLCDTAVYTRNRNFRLYLSSKMGKNNPLVLSKRCRFYKESSKISNKQIFLDSLVIPAYNVRNEAILEPLSVDNTIVECSREALVLNIKVEPLSNEGSNFIEYLSGYGSSSPFPILDYHIISINRCNFSYFPFIV
uniref:DNA-directed primase/polymerase protein n=1 Tax=Parascaris univalens TaxID=6257 RepID=A0A915BXT0_PARUN